MRRSTKDEDVALPPEHSVVVVGRGRSSDAGREPLGENAPVSLLGLMSIGAPPLFPSLKEHGGGTVRRGSEWIPRGEPEDSGAEVLFFIFHVLFSAQRVRRSWAAAEAMVKKKKAPPENEFEEELFFPSSLLFIFFRFLFRLLVSSSLEKTCARSIARGSRQQLLSMPRLPLGLLPARGQEGRPLHRLREYY